jgi:uncharacterized membrane protein YeaQ/YmgE (transglycosylase-associated protein family)
MVPVFGLWKLLLWIIIGGAAGWLTGIITKGKGYGCLGNVAVGIVGSVVGGWLFQKGVIVTGCDEKAKCKLDN